MGKITNDMYSKLPNLVFGFHGCRKSTYDAVIVDGEQLKPSENKYDWLGNGIYFWENSYERAHDWAKAKYGDDAAVVGAILDLGHCLNLTDFSSTKVLKRGYDILTKLYKKTGEELPQNTNGRSETDVLLRNLDCMVIQQIHAYNTERYNDTYDSIRGVFIEGLARNSNPSFSVVKNAGNRRDFGRLPVFSFCYFLDPFGSIDLF